MSNFRQVPTGDCVFLTANKSEKTAGGIELLGDQQIFQEQQILKVGTDVQNYKVGDEVSIDFEKFIVEKTINGKVAKNPMTLDGESDNVLTRYKEVSIPVYVLDGVEVIPVSQYKLLPWRIPAEELKGVDKTKIVKNLKDMN